MKKLGLALAALTLMAVAGFAADKQCSLKPGEDMNAFQVMPVTGQFKGQQTCLV
jgi:hypothetical protein